MPQSDPTESTADRPCVSQDGSYPRGLSRVLRSDPVICLIIILASVVVLPLVMMAPGAILTRYPIPAPKTAVQLLSEKMEGLGIEFDSASYKRGQALFTTTCVACHLPDGGARPNLGKDVVHSAFVAGKTDKELMMFLKMGRNPGDPMNTSGVDMPPKGGNPALMDKDLAALITFIRGRQATEDVTFSR